MDTFELLPSLADGELATSSAPELVAAIFRSRASGTLTIDTPTGEVRQFFRAGQMCGSAFFSGFHTLAQMLLKYEWANALDIDSTLAEAQAQKRRHGEILIERGMLTAEQLEEALAAQHRHNLLALMRLDRGHYELRGWEPPPAWTQELNIDPVGPLFEALAEERMAKRRAHLLLWLQGQPAALTREWDEIALNADLSDDDLRAIGQLARGRTRSGFVAVTRLDPAHAEALLSGLLLIGGAEPKAPAALAGAPRSAPPPPPDDESLLIPLDQDEGLLELLPDDEAFGPPHAPASAPVIAAASPAAPLSRTSAVEPMIAPPAPSMVAPRTMPIAGPKTAPIAAPRTAPIAVQTQAAPARSMPPPPPPEAVEPTAEGAQLLAQVHERLRAAVSETPWQRLGVSAQATNEQIRAAYLDAVRKYHPDRGIALGLASAQEELQTHFAAIQDAYDRIATPAARAQYEAELKNPLGGLISRQDEASLALKMSDVLLRKRDFAGALVKLRRSVDLAPSSDSLAALAWGLLCNPASTPEQRSEAKTLIERALRTGGATARTHYVAGVMSRSVDPAAAEESFLRALDLDPSHAAAAQELRLLKLRHGTRPPAPPAGTQPKRK